MALITTKERYIEAVKELYPEGSFWDEQFADKESDLSLLAEAQAETLYNMKIELNKLWLEARLDTCTEDTIADYERAYTKKIQPDLSLAERKNAIKTATNPSLKVDWDKEKEYIESAFGVSVLSIEPKIKPAFFPETKCGQNRIYDYRAFAMIIVSLAIPEKSDTFSGEKLELEKEIIKYIDGLTMANQFIYLKIKEIK